MRLAILILEDEPDVRAALQRDLASFAERVRIEAAEDATTAREITEEIAHDGDRLALVLADHRLPGTTGIDFLIGLRMAERTGGARKVLVTGQADQEDTIRAINEAGLDHYVTKPWDPDTLRALTRELLTDYVMANRLDPLPHLSVMDAGRALELLHQRSDQ
ncbi:MAG: response regulator [Sphingobacteriia bacterium]|nr:response regulator [Sphingobacteriia bacterium]NCC38708.1 response regulator [Gammaproteobacteria bacterium]